MLMPRIYLVVAYLFVFPLVGLVGYADGTFTSGELIGWLGLGVVLIWWLCDV